MSKLKKTILIILAVVALLGICFGSLAIYAKKEINKPRFEAPEAPAEEALSKLPETKEEAFAYVADLFEKSASADNVEISQHTDAHFPSEGRETSFRDADQKVFARILDNAQANVSALYRSDEGVLASEFRNPLKLGFTAGDIIDFSAERGYKDDKGETVDDGNYYISFTLKPESMNTDRMLQSDIRKNAEKELASLADIRSLDIRPDSFTASFRIVYASDMLVWAEIKKDMKLDAAVDFTGDYKALSDETSKLLIPYETVQTIDYFNYGLHFTERQLAVRNKDMKALPLDVRVNSETTSDEFKLTFDVSKDGILDIDKDGVMNVVGVDDGPVTVTASLQYRGRTYTDTLLVYTTELEVQTDEAVN
ncbi:MAG: hypothetical protein K5761_05700 [Clostridiales bacterium]|nr:hypothetical protein [Clostridiales bacterium]